jgi:hypothetical protein
MSARNVVLIDNQEKIIKLEGLREAAQIGFDALDRGAFKEFDCSEKLQNYLNGLSEKLISATAK